jgi:hypothetical protein
LARYRPRGRAQPWGPMPLDTFDRFNRSLAAAGVRGDVDRLKEAEAALLGVAVE